MHESDCEWGVEIGESSVGERVVRGEDVRGERDE